VVAQSVKPMTDPIVSPSGQTIGSRDGNVLRDANGNRGGDIIGNVMRDSAGNEVGRAVSDGHTTRYYDKEGRQIGVSHQSASADTASSNIPAGQSPLYHPPLKRRPAPRGRRNDSPLLVRAIGMLVGLVIVFYVAIFLVNVVSLVFSLIGCAVGVPLLSRVFSHPKAQRFMLINGLVMLSVVWLSVLLLALHLRPNTYTPFVPLGIFYALVLVVGLLQGLLSRRYPQYVEGSGYGLLNLRTVFVPAPLSHRFDLLHDAAVALVLELAFLGINHTSPSQAALDVITGVLLAVGYAWYCQRRFAGLRLQPVGQFTTGTASTPPISSAPVAFTPLSMPQSPIVPGSAADLVQRGQRLLDTGDLSEAQALARQAYQLDKTNPDALVLVSRLLTDPAQQMSYVKNALQADPLHVGALVRYRELTHSTPAAHPVSAEVAVLMQQAQVHLTAGDLPGATALAQQAYQLDKTSPAVLVLVSRVMPSPQRQQELVIRALQTDPLNAEALTRYRELTARVEPSHPTPAPAVSLPSSAALRSPDVPPQRSIHFSPRLLVLATGLVGLLVVAMVVFGLTRATDTPDGAARQYIHALLTGDENTIMNTLAADLRASTTSFCTQPYAACLLGHIPLVVGSTDLDSQLIRQTGQLALVQVRVHPSNAPADLCVQVQMRNENGWKVLGTTSNPAPCEAN